MNALELADALENEQGCEHCNHPLYAATRCRVCGRVTEQAEPVEPVAWMQPRTLDGYLRPDLGYETCSKSDYGAFPVYTAPPQRKPLTQEQLYALYDEHATHQEEGPAMSGWFDFARAIERAHGIKE